MNKKYSLLPIGKVMEIKLKHEQKQEIPYFAFDETGNMTYENQELMKMIDECCNSISKLLDNQLMQCLYEIMTEQKVTMNDLKTRVEIFQKQDKEGMIVNKLLLLDGKAEYRYFVKQDGNIFVSGHEKIGEKVYLMCPKSVDII